MPIQQSVTEGKVNGLIVTSSRSDWDSESDDNGGREKSYTGR